MKQTVFTFPLYSIEEALSTYAVKDKPQSATKGSHKKLDNEINCLKQTNTVFIHIRLVDKNLH